MSLKKKIVHVVGGNQQVIDLFEHMGYGVEKDYSKAFHAAVFTGGSDITPFLYGERPLRNTKFDPNRDLLEIKKIKDLPFDFPKIGICRGAQLLNVTSGGTLWQDVDEHAGKAHLMQLYGDKGQVTGQVMVNSTHHQQMIVGDAGTVLAAANKSNVKLREGEERTYWAPQINAYDDTEVAWYWYTNSLCYQPHPEYALDSANYTCFKSMVADYVFGLPLAEGATK